jgi:SAM-dependent methyltransferase
VADVGCGNGAYHGALRLAGAATVAIDLSPGMLQSVARGPVGRVAADAQALPLAADSIDAVLAMHMLYHMPDPAVAVDGVARVRGPSGQLVAAVGGPQHLFEAERAWVSLVADAGLDDGDADLRSVNDRLSAARLKEILGARFGRVVSRMLSSQVLRDTPEPLLRHAASTTAAREANRRGTNLIALLRALADDIIKRDGLLRITTEVAWFSASNAAP